MRIKPKKASRREAQPKKISIEKIVGIITATAENKKASEITALDISKQSNVADYFIIISVESTPQMNAAAEAIIEELEKHGIIKHHVEGTLSSGWLIIDLGAVVVHIMGVKERDFYKLETLWGKSGITYHV